VKTESLALKGFMRVDSVSLLSTRQRQSDLRDQIHREFVNRPSISTNAVSFSSAPTMKRFPFAAMRVSNPDRQPISTDRLAHGAAELTGIISLHGQNFRDGADLFSIYDLDC
jgi:hypothetical protein